MLFKAFRTPNLKDIKKVTTSRDDNSVGRWTAIRLIDFDAVSLKRIVIPTGAYPDFLLRGPHQSPLVRLSVKESRMKIANATKFDRKSGVAQWRDLLCALPSNNSLQLRPSTSTAAEVSHRP